MAISFNRSLNTGCPCVRECPDRCETCHVHCEKYNQWKKKRDEMKQAEQDCNREFFVMSDSRRRKIWKMHRYSRQNWKHNKSSRER